MKLGVSLSIMFFLCGAVNLSVGQQQRAPETIRAKLTLNKNERGWLIWSVDFDTDHVQKTLKERKVKLPAGLSHEARIGVSLDKDHVVFIFEKVQGPQGGESVRVTVDTNQSNDLSDEKPIQFIADEKSGNEIALFSIERFLGSNRTQSSRLPYYLGHTTYKNKDGMNVERYSYGTRYCMDGTLNVDAQKYKIRLWDITMDGKYDQDDLKMGSAVAIDLNGDGKYNENEFFMGDQLIPLAGSYYLFESVAEDGSEIVFHRTELRPLKIGGLAPDLPLTDSLGKRFRLSDYRGRVVLLDFWASWCHFCLEAFPSVIDFAKNNADNAFIVIGINVDDAKFLDKAHQVIEKYGLTWREVMEGKGTSGPLMDAFGSKSEFGKSVPLYIVIDKKGIVRAGSAEFEKVKKILDELVK
jgi:thiol-disulfide isomerase/thioredoxin